MSDNNLLNLATIFVWVAVLCLYFLVQKIKKRIISACTLEEIIYFRCGDANSLRTSSKKLRKFMSVLVVVMSVILAVELVLRAVAGELDQLTAVGYLNIFSTWLISLGCYMASTALLNLFAELEKKCTELSKSRYPRG